MLRMTVRQIQPPHRTNSPSPHFMCITGHSLASETDTASPSDSISVRQQSYTRAALRKTTSLAAGIQPRKPL